MKTSNDSASLTPPDTHGDAFNALLLFILNFYLFFYSLAKTAQHVGSNPGLLHWKGGVLTTGLPGKSLYSYL